MQISSNRLSSLPLKIKDINELNNQNQNRQAAANQLVSTKPLQFGKLALSATAQSQSLAGVNIDTGERTVGSLPYGQYFSALDLNGLTDDEKDVIGKAISAATSIDPKLTSKGLTNDQFAMFLSQTKAQLDFVSEHVVPEPYQNQMMQATDRYIQENLSNFNDQVKTIELAIQSHNQDKAGPFRQIAQYASQTIQAINEGTSTFQNEQHQYLTLYSELKGTAPKEFLQNYEKAMNGYKENKQQEMQKYWNASMEKHINDNINLFRTGWNDFISRLPRFEDYRVSTREKPLFEQTI